ncbi:MAG: serine peptidase, partial [Anaerolineae bacterium]|nr:serine peptidase [Anaerolineae bacterium]
LIHDQRRHVPAAGEIWVDLPDGSEHRAQVLAYDPHLDLAALAIEAHGLPTIALGNSGALLPGEWVTALGFPWGVPGGTTSGIVIGQGIALPEASLPNRDWLMVSLHLRPGHSGGPLVNTQGALVGINTLMTGPDVGGAVPVDTVKRFLKQRMV